MISDIPIGKTQTYKFTFTDLDGVVLNITGHSVEFVAKTSIIESASVISVTTTAGDHADDDAVGGIMFLTLNTSDTDLTPQNLVYAFIHTVPGATPLVYELEDGNFNITRSVKT